MERDTREKASDLHRGELKYEIHHGQLEQDEYLISGLLYQHKNRS